VGKLKNELPIEKYWRERRDRERKRKTKRFDAGKKRVTKSTPQGVGKIEITVHDSDVTPPIRLEMGRFKCVRIKTGFEKICKTCRNAKPFSEFHFNKGLKRGKPARTDGLSIYCKSCANAKRQKAYKGLGEQRKEELNKQKSEYYYKNQEKFCKKNREWRKGNRKKVSQQSLEEYHRKKTTFHGQIELRFVRKIRKSVAKRNGPTNWPAVFGYTFEALRKHLEDHFTKGMTWDLFMSGKIEIDHIIPKCSFYYETVYEPEFKACWALSNLQPMWGAENRRKGDRMPDGKNGRDIGLAKEFAYELRLAQMSAGG